MMVNAVTTHVVYNPRGFTPKAGFVPVEGLDKLLSKIAPAEGITISSPYAHRPSSAYEIDTFSDLFLPKLNNKHGAKGYILYADFLMQQLNIEENPSLGAERLIRCINSTRCCPKPILVVLFTSPLEDYPDLVRALEGRAYLISCDGKPVNRLVHEIITCFTSPVEY